MYREMAALSMRLTAGSRVVANSPAGGTARPSASGILRRDKVSQKLLLP